MPGKKLHTVLKGLGGDGKKGKPHSSEMHADKKEKFTKFFKGKK